MSSYVPNNAYVYAFAYAGAMAGAAASALASGQGSPTGGTYLFPAQVAYAFAQAVDTAWGVEPANEYDISNILVASGLAFRDRAPLFPSAAKLTQSSNWTAIALAIVAETLEGDLWLAQNGIAPPPIPGGGSGPETAATVVSGETYTLLPTDTAIRFDTTGGSTAAAVLSTPAYIGQRVTFYWWAWGAGQVAPTINTSVSTKLVPFSGQATSGAAGLATTTTISTPGASYTLEWNGTEWMGA